MAVRAGMEQAVSLLVDAGVDVTISAPNTGTARDIAVANEAKLIADLLDARTNAIATAARQSASIPIRTSCLLAHDQRSPARSLRCRVVCGLTCEHSDQGHRVDGEDTR
jgi:hypothetical protein